MQSTEEAAESAPGAMRMVQPESFPAYGTRRKTISEANGFSNCCPCFTSPVNLTVVCKPSAGVEAGAGGVGSTPAALMATELCVLLQAMKIRGSERTHNLATERVGIGCASPER